jgi:hypothetical protein
MPVLHRYTSKRGMYVKARRGSVMMTYQLTGAAVAKFRQRGIGDGARIGKAELARLIERGDAYTNGSGAGRVEASPKKNRDRRQTAPRPPSHPVPPVPSPSVVPRAVARIEPQPSPVRPPTVGSRPATAPRRQGQLRCRLCGATCSMRARQCWYCGSRGYDAFRSAVPPCPIDHPLVDAELDWPHTRVEFEEEKRSQSAGIKSLLRRVVMAVNYEILGIPLWLWAYIFIGLAVPVYLLSRLALGGHADEH